MKRRDPASEIVKCFLGITVYRNNCPYEQALKQMADLRHSVCYKKSLMTAKSFTYTIYLKDRTHLPLGVVVLHKSCPNNDFSAHGMFHFIIRCLLIKTGLVVH